MAQTHLPELIRDLAIILVAAGAVSFIFQKLKQPVVLGYLLVGFLVGPHFSYLPNVTSLPSIQVWAEIGVIFLLFSLGLEFSFHKLIKVGGPATITALIEIPAMMLTGFITGFALGWSTLDSLFLGGVISISSTSIIVRTVEDLRLKSRQFVGLVFGVLIFEDLIAILLMVLLTTVAVTRQFAGLELLWAAGRLGLFLVVWFVVGIFLIPSFVRHARRMWSDENTLIFAVGLCLLMVLLATQFGFSPALGAFMMGSILAETDERQRIEHLLKPLKHLFAAIFFVSVGMLFQPTIWIEHTGTLLTILLVTIVGKTVFPALGALISGQSLKTSVQTGMSLAQIGEFSFIIATLGMRLNVTSDQLYTIAVSVSILTTFTTPYFIRHSEGISRWLDGKLPDHFKKRLRAYQRSLNDQDNPLFGHWLKAHLPRILINSAFIVAIVILFRWLATPYIPSNWLRLSLCLILSLPFFWGLALSRIKSKDRSLGIDRAVGWLRIALAISLFVVLLLQFTSRATFYWTFAIIVPISGLLLFRYGERIYHWLESRIVGELGANAEAEGRDVPLLPWDAHLSVVEIPPHSIVCGQSIAQIGFKETFGLLVTVIERAQRKILAPSADSVLYPYDRLYLVGSDEALEKIVNLVETTSEDLSDREMEYKLFGFTVEPGTQLVGTSLRDSGLREGVGLIVGVERKGVQLLNPPADYVFAAKDRIWIVGDPEKMRLSKNH